MHNRSDVKQSKLELHMEGLQAWRVERMSGDGHPYLLVDMAKPVRTLNSSPWGGGFGHHRFLVNRQVDMTYNNEDPISEMEIFLDRQQLDVRATACLMTAARVADISVESASYGEAKVTSLVTVGLGNKARAGLAVPSPQLYPGTINSIVLVSGTMTDSAMVNAVITATEAKSAALQELDERVEGAGYATGTTSDAVLIASIGNASMHRYAGTATEVGYLIGRTVYEATVSAGRRYQAYVRSK
ncbi:adenosylcobinamide amidohydrolase [Paenibacillus agricola]|uniref:Adenosylcobinamide amidohydrolase n=1 Tax=Paenibacillus agricola TaxID=2716264 RepID=A0ABX0JJL5_9BACL|nr:adenosylcobinamide amidohydrolase [Paenibacillus agricola]NHN34106.1 adenosylcobinamide amidohydrolase [Paenibacillus agricola]